MRIALAASSLAVVLAAAGLVSCSGPEGPPLTPGPGPSGTPVFASDEEALAAAEGAYQRYLDVSNSVGKDGWKHLELLADVERGDALEADTSSVEKLREAGYRQLGEGTFDSMTLQQYEASALGVVRITVYVCLDVSNVDVVDQDGESAVSPDRPDRQSLEVGFDDTESELKVSRSEAWSGASFC